MTETVTAQEAADDTLPQSWEWAQVEQLGDVVTGNTPSTKERQYYGGSVPLFKPTDLNAGYWVSKSETTLTKTGAEKARVLPAKSILVTCIGATIGKTGLSQSEGATNQQINALVPSKEHLVPEYLYFGFISRLLQDQILSNASSTTLPILNKSKFGRLEIPLPPLNEQRRIVEKIEELFTKLDAGVRFLEQAQAQLKSYRRSVLKAAVEGELSREWREAHGDKLEPASELLNRILQERREKFTGKKYKEPDSPDTSKLPTIPDGWAWASLDHLGEVIGGLTKNRKRETYPLQLPYLRVANVYANELRLNDVEEIGVEDSELNRLLLESGDLLVVEGNGSPDQIGRVALWGGNIDTCVHQNHLIKVRFFQTSMSRYALYWLLSSKGREHIKRVASSTSGLYTLSLSKVKALPIPLPPLEEQHFIVEEVERRLSVVDKLEATVEENLKQAAGLRQSILKQAFAGELAPQDPDDEPASVLLARIRSEREATKPKARKKGVKAKREAPADVRVPELFPERGA